MVNGASGQIIWQNPGLSLNEISQVEVISIGGEETIILPQGKTNFIDKLDLVNVRNGASVGSIDVKTGPESTGGNIYQVKSTGKDTLFLASNYGDLLLVSSEGDVLWDYPRVTDVYTESGEFYGDSTEDLLILSRIYPSGKQIGNSTSRVIYVLDGATKQKVWSYEVPYDEYVATGGIQSIQIIPDINGDGMQDIAGFIQIPDWQMKGVEYGEDTRIIVLSGRDGTILLKQPVMEWIWSFGVISFSQGGPAPVCLLVKTQRGMYLLNPAGKVLITWRFQNGPKNSAPFGPGSDSTAEVKYDTEGLLGQKEVVLDDLNGDGANDLATMNNMEIYITTTEISSNGDLDFNLIRTIKVEQGIGWNQGWLEDDLRSEEHTSELQSLS
jgi:hypothetical protein